MGVRLKSNFNKIFPTEIVSEILTRLPTKTVLESKLVCKTWNNLINHPSFPRRHLARLNHPDSTGNLRYVSLDAEYSNYGSYLGYEFYYFKYNDNEDWNYVKPIHRDIMSETIPCEDYIVIGSFNGLICVYGYDIPDSEACGPAIIFNPVTKEYISLPNCIRFLGSYEDENLIGHYHLGCGFGYLAETNEYKVVRMFTHVSEPKAIEVEVYTVGSDKGWRHVRKFDVGMTDLGFTYEDQHAVFLNGALHWRNAVGGMVVVFDLADEKFRQHIPPPPLLTGTDDDGGFEGNIVLGVSGGGILYYAVRQSLEGREINDVWLLEKKKDNHEQKEHQSCTTRKHGLSN